MAVTAWFVQPAQGGPIDPGTHPFPEAAQAVHEAEHAVDHAWETYHKAALGGTIASPAVQAEIEQHLHEARALVPQARSAAERGEVSQVQRLVDAITIHIDAAIAGSMEHKQ
jgi:hypothetical protein